MIKRVERSPRARLTNLDAVPCSPTGDISTTKTGDQMEQIVGAPPVVEVSSGA